jgi:hypothetical protein
MYGNGVAVPVVRQHTGKSSSKLGQLLRELSDDEDNVTPTPHTQRESSLEASKPWLCDFNGYLQSWAELGNMSIVEWWGVSAIFLYCETLIIHIILVE